MFEGYLIKINGIEFPLRLMAYESYKCTPAQRMDKDSYRNGDGVLHRNVLAHRPSKLEFTTLEGLKLADVKQILSIVPDAPEMEIIYWNDRKVGYSTGRFYCPDIDFEYQSVNKDNITYKPIRFAFIEY